jgi:hypothetical protein
MARASQRSRNISSDAIGWSLAAAAIMADLADEVLPASHHAGCAMKQVRLSLLDSAGLRRVGVCYTGLAVLASSIFRPPVCRPGRRFFFQAAP